MLRRNLTLSLLVLYALLTVYPAISIAFGAMPSIYITPFTTLTGFLFALLHASGRMGWGRALRLLGSVFFVSLAFESVGVATGWIYGPYHYTNRLGPLFLGLVPILIPIAWFMMSYPSFVIADRLIPATWKRWQRILSVSALGGLVMTAWDLVMDPVMVAGGHWVWDIEGAYFGIPLQNFLGWWLTVFASYALYMLVAGKDMKSIDPRFDRLAVASYLVTAFGIILASFVGGAAPLGLIGIFSMLPWVVAGGSKTADNECKTLITPPESPAD